MIFENSLPKANFGQNIRDSPNGSLTADSRSLQTATLNPVNRGKFLIDLKQLPWANVDLYSDLNEMWRVWKEMFLGCVDKHTLLKSKRIENSRKKQSLCITRELLSKIRENEIGSNYTRGRLRRLRHLRRLV